ncbi:MAG TPA: hypothetical protein G4O03_01760 [Dehalococcoidia bacterium]|nr:hypothetical protein [Dehalococcoidia bacterium]
MKQKAIYFRASPELASRVKEQAAKKGVSASAAVAELVEVGLEFVDKQGTIEDLKKSLEQERHARSIAEGEVQRLRREKQQIQEETGRNLRMLQDSYNGLLGHLRVTDLAVCPSCRQILSAYDVIIQRRCSQCSIAVSLGSVADPQRPGPLIRDLLAVVGGIAVFAGIVNALSNRDSA